MYLAKLPTILYRIKESCFLCQNEGARYCSPPLQGADLHKPDRNVMQYDFAKIRPSAACLLLDGIRLRWRSFRKVSS